MKKITKNNKEILEALISMVKQHFYEDKGLYKHSFMSTDENAISLLEDYGIAEEVAPYSYKIKDLK